MTPGLMRQRTTTKPAQGGALHADESGRVRQSAADTANRQFRQRLTTPQEDR